MSETGCRAWCDPLPGLMEVSPVRQSRTRGSGAGEGARPTWV
jgi:hypothetical protein